MASARRAQLTPFLFRRIGRSKTANKKQQLYYIIAVLRCIRMTYFAYFSVLQRYSYWVGVKDLVSLKKHTPTCFRMAILASRHEWKICWPWRCRYNTNERMMGRRCPQLWNCWPPKIDEQNRARWWFQMFFIFTPTWGRFPFWLIFFKWVETTKQINNPFIWRFLKVWVERGWFLCSYKMGPYLSPSHW